MTRNIIILVLVALLPLGASMAFYRMGIRADFAERLFGKPSAEDLWEGEKPMPGWREADYLAAYPDVAAAVRGGQYASGYEHFRLYGRNEGRTAGLPKGGGPAMAVAIQPAPAPTSMTNPPPTTPPATTAPTAPAAPPATPARPLPPAGRPTVAEVLPKPPPAPAPAPDKPEPSAHRPDPATYIVRSGGALSRVAEVTGIPLADLRKANPDLPNAWLPAGTVVTLPPPSAPPASMPTPTPAPAPPSAPDAAAVAAASAPPAPSPASPPPVAVPKPEAPPPGAVTGIRFGMNPDYTRIVLDLSAAPAFRAATQLDERTIAIDLPGTAWKTARDGSVMRTTPSLSFHVEPAGSGTRLLVTGREDIRVRRAVAFPPEGTRGHRIVIDVGRDAP